MPHSADPLAHGHRDSLRIDGSDDLPGATDRLIEELNVELVPYDLPQVVAFQHAYLTYGRGGHNTSQARLNLGDCSSYALAKTLGEPLLYIGNDFSHTDIVSALRQEGSRPPLMDVRQGGAGVGRFHASTCHVRTYPDPTRSPRV